MFQLSEPPKNLSLIEDYDFFKNMGIKSINFKTKPETIVKYTFLGCSNIFDIYVPWAEGEVADAPWEATNATIHYNN